MGTDVNKEILVSEQGQIEEETKDTQMNFYRSTSS